MNCKSRKVDPCETCNPRVVSKLTHSLLRLCPVNLTQHALDVCHCGCCSISHVICSCFIKLFSPLISSRAPNTLTSSDGGVISKDDAVLWLGLNDFVYLKVNGSIRLAMTFSAQVNDDLGEFLFVRHVTHFSPIVMLLVSDAA